MSESHDKAPPATASEGFSQGPYVAAREGFEPATLECIENFDSDYVNVFIFRTD